MARVRLAQKQTIVYEGKSYGPDSGAFEMDDRDAEGLIRNGILEVVPQGKPKETETKKPKAPARPPAAPVSSLPEVMPPWIKALKKRGIETVEDLATADIDVLTEIKGIGKATATRLIDAALAAL